MAATTTTDDMKVACMLVLICSESRLFDCRMNSRLIETTRFHYLKKNVKDKFLRDINIPKKSQKNFFT